MRNSSVEFVVSELKAGRVAKLRPLPENRKNMEHALWVLNTYPPIVDLACEYYDTLTSGLPEAAELHEKLLATIRYAMDNHKL